VLGWRSLGNGSRQSRLGMKERGDGFYLGVRELEGRHALAGTPVSHYFADQVSIHVMADQGRENEVGPACTAAIRAMAKPAGLRKLPLSGGNIRIVGLLLANVRCVLGKEALHAQTGKQNEKETRPLTLPARFQHFASQLFLAV